MEFSFDIVDLQDDLFHGLDNNKVEQIVFLTLNNIFALLIFGSNSRCL